MAEKAEMKTMEFILRKHYSQTYFIVKYIKYKLMYVITLFVLQTKPYLFFKSQKCWK